MRRSKGSTIEVDELGAAVLVRTAADAESRQVGPLRAMVGSLGRGQGEFVVVCSPAVSARPDLFGEVSELLGQGSGPAVRLILLGNGPAADKRVRGLRATSTRTGRDLAVSMGPVWAASDGACAAAAAPGSDGGWFACRSDGESRYEAPWWPRPSWTPPTWPTGTGDVKVHPVPAGLWLLPPDRPPGRAGVVTSLPCHADRMSVFVGGCGQALAPADVARVLTGLNLARPAQLILLPGALAGADPRALELWLDEVDVEVAAAVPVWSGQGWDLALVSRTGVVFHPGVPDTAPAATGHEPRTAIADRAAVGHRTVGHRTRAGWSFLDSLFPEIGFAPAVGAALVEVAAVPAGFRVDGRLLTPAEFAGLLRTTLGPLAGPLVLAGPGVGPDTLIMSALRDALHWTVIAADAPVTLTATGLLLTEGAFVAFRSAGPVRRLGAVFPPGATSEAAVELAARVSRDWPAGNGTRDVPDVFAGLAVDEYAPLVDVPNVPAEPAEPADPARSPESAEAVDGVDASESDIEDAAVLRTYCGGARDPVNHYLRGGLTADAAATAALAGSLRDALSRLPVVVGPVFAACATPARTYPPGLDIVEASFVDASLTPLQPGAPVQYVIWSSTARRVDGPLAGDRPLAIFPAGSGFTVLDVDVIDGPDAALPAGTLRVYLADAAVPLAGVDIAALVSRLRAASLLAVTDPRAPLSAPIGVRAEDGVRAEGVPLLSGR